MFSFPFLFLETASKNSEHWLKFSVYFSTIYRVLVKIAVLSLSPRDSGSVGVEWDQETALEASPQVILRWTWRNSGLIPDLPLPGLKVAAMTISGQGIRKD